MSKIIPNPLNIAEPALLKHHHAIISCFIQNNIEFEAEYNQEFNSELNSTVFYTIKTNARRCGFVSSPNDSFAGAVIKGEKISHLRKEGFDEEQIMDSEPIFAHAPCVMAFVSMLAIDRLGKLKFNRELIEEFDKIVKTKKAGGKTKNKGRK